MITHITYFIIYFFYCHGFELCGEHLAKGLEQNRSLKPVKLDGSLSPQHQELHETSTHSCTSVHTLEGGELYRVQTTCPSSLAVLLLFLIKHPTQRLSVRARPSSYWSRNKFYAKLCISLERRSIMVVILSTRRRLAISRDTFGYYY